MPRRIARTDACRCIHNLRFTSFCSHTKPSFPNFHFLYSLLWPSLLFTYSINWNCNKGKAILLLSHHRTSMAWIQDQHFRDVSRMGRRACLPADQTRPRHHQCVLAQPWPSSFEKAGYCPDYIGLFPAHREQGGWAGVESVRTLIASPMLRIHWANTDRLRGKARRERRERPPYSTRWCNIRIDALIGFSFAIKI